MSDVCVVGSFMMDMIVRTPHLPVPGQTITGDSLLVSPGGKGYNQAIAAARAGASTTMIGAVGHDAFGQAFIDDMRKEGVDATGVRVLDGPGTGVGIPMVEAGGQNAIVIVPQANLAVTPDIVRTGLEEMGSARVVVLQLEIPDDAVIEAAREAHDRGYTVILNPAPFRPVAPELIELVDVLVPNELELDQLAASWGIGGVDAPDVALQVARRAGCAVVVTLGEDGVAVFTEDHAEVVPSYRVEAVDTVGAGDTFIGNLAAGIARGVSLVESAARANAAAAVSVTRHGGAASTPTAAEVDAFLAARGVAAC